MGNPGGGAMGSGDMSQTNGVSGTGMERDQFDDTDDDDDDVGNTLGGTSGVGAGSAVGTTDGSMDDDMIDSRNSGSSDDDE